MRSAAPAALLLALTAAIPSCADDGGSAGLDLTVGSNAYREVRAHGSLDLSEDAYLAPRALFYRSNDVNGTYKLFGLRGGYEPGPWSFGGDVAVQPRVDGYAKSSIGADAAYTFPLSDTAKESALDLGGGVTLTRHSDAFEAAPGGRGRGRERSADFVVHETDVFVLGAVRASQAVVSLRASVSSYDRDLAAADARRVLASAGDGFDAAIVGFPESMVTAKLRLKTFPDAEPFASFTHTTFELGDPPANAIEAGATVYKDRISLTASFEVYRQSGFADRDYLTFGAALDF